MMKPDREAYFSTRMNDLADLFNKVSARYQAILPVDPDADIYDLTHEELNFIFKKADPKLAQISLNHQRASIELWEEFSREGYTPEQWNDLMRTSGAMNRFGFGDGEDDAPPPPTPAP
jgi:hypothetical protein